jgi:hypothetical protein
VSTSVSPANLHSTKLSIIIITRGRYKRPFRGGRTAWIQLGLHPPPPLIRIKIISPGAGTRGHSVAGVPSGSSLDSTPLIRIKKIKHLHMEEVINCTSLQAVLFNNNIQIKIKFPDTHFYIYCVNAVVYPFPRK